MKSIQAQGIPLPIAKCCGECGRTYTHIPQDAQPWENGGQTIGLYWNCHGTHKEGPTTFFIPKSKYVSAPIVTS